MSIAVNHVNELILEQLSHREMRLLSLAVAVRKSFTGNETFKGDLTASIKASLRKLVAAKRVVDVEGIYSLAAPAAAGVGKD